MFIHLYTLGIATISLLVECLPGVVVYVCNPSYPQAQVGGLQSGHPWKKKCKILSVKYLK